MDITPNRIEQQYRALMAVGHPVERLFLANPNDEGITFPGEILTECYARYFGQQAYRPDARGLRVAREAVAGYYTQHDVTIDPDRILLTAGTSESFFYLFALLAAPGDNILTPTPSYPLFDAIARLAHVTLRPYALREDKEWAIDCDAIRAAIDARTRAIVIVSPHNPTGMVADVATVEQLTAIANSHGLALICDEVFSEFIELGTGTNSELVPVPNCSPALCFTLNGISKMFALPAMKCSWITVSGEPARVATAVDRLEHMTDAFLSCHYPIQLALPELFARGAAFLAAYRAEVGRRRALALSILRQSPHLRFHAPIGGFYLMAEVVNGRWRDEEECICDLMTNYGIFPHPGYFYDHERGIHLVLSTLLAPERMNEGLVRLCKAIAMSS